MKGPLSIPIPAAAPTLHDITDTRPPPPRPQVEVFGSPPDMEGNIDLPIALRRARRSSSALRVSTSTVQSSKPEHSPASSSGLPTPADSTDSIASTPRGRGRPRKKVRFSDPGPALDQLLSSVSSSTGLTPMVRRTSLAAPKRRHSTPVKPSSTPAGSRRGSGLGLDNPSSPFSGDVTIVPLRQVLDGRVKRRIRRNGLSEEMNTIHAEKKRRSAELQRLKNDLAYKDAEIVQLRESQQRLRDSQRQHTQETCASDPDETIDTVVGDTERIFDLEREVADLRRQLLGRSPRAGAPNISDHTPRHDWTMAARDPFAAEDYSMMDVGSFPADHSANGDDDDDDDDVFGDMTMADLHCSTPSRSTIKGAPVTGAGSFPTPPATSPLAAMAPCTPNSLRSPTPRSNSSSVQASLPDPDKQVLEEELTSLQLEVAKITTTLKSYQSLATRVSEKMAAFTTTTPALADSDAIVAAIAANPSSPDPVLEARITTLLTTVSDRSAALLSLSSSLSNLGFQGSDAGEIIASLASAFRTARLELEYLTPGEVTLPLTSAGAAVLDLLLARLRDLSKRTREDESAIDEYHAQELSLRKQLAARVDIADDLGKEVASLKADLSARDATVAELQVGLDRLKGAAAGYARDVAELEKLVERLETQRLAALDECEQRLQDSARDKEDELAASAAENEVVVGALEAKLAASAADKVAAVDALEAKLAASAAEKDAAVSALEANLAAAVAQAGDLRAALATAGADAALAAQTHADETRALNADHGRQLALRDARVVELRAEVERVSEALRAAHETVVRLRADADRLEDRLCDEQDAAVAAVDAMKAQLEMVVAMGQQFLTAATPKAAARPPRSTPSSALGGGAGALDATPTPAVRPGGLFDAGKARRRSSSVASLGDDAESPAGPAPASPTRTTKRRRYDSGLGFLDEEEVNASMT
ncbi:hypothetical protein RB596_004889 [Gaeumannomyces avenae]